MTSRKFAIEVTQKLQKAGYVALWAGGCVRDQKLGKIPKDYDVATSARPEQVRELFGHKRTLAIGESFGVISVLGPKSAGPIEVATFRRDAGYSDGRRPDTVEFTDAREDAIRRDFTINGMFYDPVEDKVHDYVGGLEDLENRLIRAIGDPHARINEDKLRMLRAVRFTSTLGFQLDAATLAAIQDHAHQIQIVSAERIGAEMRRMLANPNRAAAARLLRKSKLLEEILDGGEKLFESEELWQQVLRGLEALRRDEFVCAASIFLSPLLIPEGIDSVVQRWKLSNDEKNSIKWICKYAEEIAKADQLPWSKVQPLLIHQDARRGIDVCEARLLASQPPSSLTGIEFCRVRLDWPPTKLNPPALIDGNDLKKLNLDAGPVFGTILTTIRREQLDEKITTRDEAVDRAREIAKG